MLPLYIICSMNLSDLTLSDLETIDKDNTVVMIPLSSVEQHGPHLPLGTKSFIAEYVAFYASKMLSEENLPALIAPAVPFMPCNSSFGFPTCFSMGARTYSDALYDIGSSFKKEGYKKLYFVNMSISPDALKAVSVAVDDLNSLSDFNAYDPMPLWNFSPNETLDEALEELGLSAANEIHADMKDTSAMMVLLPDLVDQKIISKLPACKVNSTWEILKGNFSFQEMGSEYGYIGTPSMFDNEFGRKYLKEASFGLSEAVKFTLAGNELPQLPMQVRMLLKMVDLDDM